jgi:hypothetical protein
VKETRISTTNPSHGAATPRTNGSSEAGSMPGSTRSRMSYHSGSGSGSGSGMGSGSVSGPSSVEALLHSEGFMQSCC